MTQPTDLRDLTFPQLGEFLQGMGLPGKRARQLFALLQRPGTPPLAEMVGLLNREVRTALAVQARVSRLLPLTTEESADGTRKYLFKLEDGALIESVLIPTATGRHTLCLSSQVGCAMGCRFCLTGRLGLTRNLRPAEIVNQVLAVIEDMIGRGIVRATPREYINNLVFMGMGEPLANYDTLVASLAILMDDRGLEFTERRITVSTCGLVPRIRELGRDVKVNLAISLHAADDETRSQLMPINRSYPLAELLAACREFPLARTKVILFEYILIEGVNDSPAAARALAVLLAGIPCRVNLLPYNESEALAFRCPPPAVVKEFQKILQDAGLRTLVRDSRGADISAACGQLANRSQSPRVVPRQESFDTPPAQIV